MPEAVRNPASSSAGRVHRSAGRAACTGCPYGPSPAGEIGGRGGARRGLATEDAGDLSHLEQVTSRPATGEARGRRANKPPGRKASGAEGRAGGDGVRETRLHRPHLSTGCLQLLVEPGDFGIEPDHLDRVGIRTAPAGRAAGRRRGDGTAIGARIGGWCAGHGHS